MERPPMTSSAGKDDATRSKKLTRLTSGSIPRLRRRDAAVHGHARRESLPLDDSLNLRASPEPNASSPGRGQSAASARKRQSAASTASNANSRAQKAPDQYEIDQQIRLEQEQAEHTGSGRTKRRSLAAGVRIPTPSTTRDVMRQDDAQHSVIPGSTRPESRSSPRTKLRAEVDYVTRYEEDDMRYRDLFRDPSLRSRTHDAQHGSEDPQTARVDAIGPATIRLSELVFPDTHENVGRQLTLTDGHDHTSTCATYASSRVHNKRKRVSSAHNARDNKRLRLQRGDRAVSSSQLRDSVERSVPQPIARGEMPENETSARLETPTLADPIHSSEDGNVQAEDDSQSTSDAADLDRRLHGQWTKLRDVRAHCKMIGVPLRDGVRRTKIRMKPVNSIVKPSVDQCRGLRERLQSHQRFEGKDLSRYISDIDDAVSALYKVTPHSEPRFDKVSRAQSIYFYLFPALFDTLRVMVLHFSVSPDEQDDTAVISTSDLEKLARLVDIILRLQGGAAKYSPRPPSDLNLIAPVTSMCAVLKTVNQKWKEAIQDAKDRMKLARERKEIAERRAVALQQEMANEAAERQTLARRKKWAALHTERLFAEGAIIKPDKRAQLRMPENVPEVDAAGNPIERLGVFVVRTGPQPALIDAARDKIWSTVEYEALEAGLKMYHGTRVFESIIRKYCVPKGALHKYTVTDIVTRATDLKEHLSKIQREEMGVVEEWVEDIPVWIQDASTGIENGLEMVER